MSLRITECTIEAFGPLADVDLSSLDHRVVVLQGRNEAGKTAFFHFLQTMFYGIYPTDGSKHPYTPRDGRQLEGALTFRTSAGTLQRVTRRLLSRPQGQLEGGEGDTERLRNRTLPVAQHVPRSVYRSVYALQLDDMVRLEGEAWDEVQDRLLGTLSVEHLRPAREVIEELEDEATDLWRTDNRGKPEAKQLEKRRSELREAARDARERDREVRRLRDEIAQHDNRIQELSEEQVDLRAEQRRAERLAPVRQLLRQIESFEERAGDLSPYDDIPEDPGAVLSELEDQISEVDERLSAAREEVEELEGALDRYGEEDAQIVSRADDIRTWGRKVERLEKQDADLTAHRRAVDNAQKRLEDVASVLSGQWDEDLAESLRSLPLADLRERIKAHERAAQRLREMEARAETIGLQAQARKSLVPWLLVAAVGAAGVLLGLTVSLPVAGVPVAAGALVLVGILQAMAAWRHNRQLDVQEEHLDLESRREEVRRRAEDVAELVDDIPLPPQRLDDPDSDLFTDLKTLVDRLRERDEAIDTLERQEEDLRGAKEDLASLAGACGLPEEERDGAVSDVVTALEDRLRVAQKRKEAADNAKEALPAARDEVETLEERRTELGERLESIEKRLEALGEGNLKEGIQELNERRTADQRAKMSRDRLHSEYPDWESYREEIDELEEGGWTYTDEERARIEQRLDEIEQALRAEERERTEKEKDVEHYLEARTVGDIESELAHVERRLEEVREQRDRRMLLAEIIGRADAEFRRKHQPDVLRRASGYLERVTSGRYQRLSLDEREDNLVVYEADEEFPRPVRPPLSQGTLDQIYLSLRLAIIDHLDADGERLPVFLDEVFVNWDPERRQAAFDLLADMSRERQVFFFTCHPHFAREAADALDAHRLNLSRLRSIDPETTEAPVDSGGEGR